MASGIYDLLQSLVDIPSESGHEDQITEFVRSALPIHLEVIHDHDTVVLAVPPPSPRPLVLLAGHTDTVPIGADLPARVSGGRLYGRGASDMKGGLAVMLNLVAHVAPPRNFDLDIGLLFFGREELSQTHNPLPAFLASSDRAQSAELVVVMEPTDNAVQLGCLGNLNLDLTFRGKAAHTARPWQGQSAIDRALDALNMVAGFEPRRHIVDELDFYEVATVTSIHSGMARNVVPPEARVEVNVRYPPGSDPKATESEWIGRFGSADEVAVVGHAHSAPASGSNPLITRLRRASGKEAEPKQAWTNVADFAAVGVPAVNFGPGDPAMAHQAGESIALEALDESRAILRRFLGQP